MPKTEKLRKDLKAGTALKILIWPLLVGGPWWIMVRDWNLVSDEPAEAQILWLIISLVVTLSIAVSARDDIDGLIAPVGFGALSTIAALGVFVLAARTVDFVGPLIVLASSFGGLLGLTLTDGE